MPTDARLQRIRKRLGNRKPNDPRHGHEGVRTWKPARYPGYGPLLAAPVEVCYGCRRPWAELVAANYLPPCPNVRAICIRWSVMDMEGNLLEHEDVWLDDPPHSEIRVVERDILTRWNKLPLERREELLPELNAIAREAGLTEGVPADIDPAEDDGDIVASDSSVDATVSQDGDQVSGEESKGPLRRGSGETEQVVHGEEGLATPSVGGDKVGPSEPPDEEEQARRAYWKRLRRDYDI